MDGGGNSQEFQDGDKGHFSDNDVRRVVRDELHALFSEVLKHLRPDFVASGSILSAEVLKTLDASPDIIHRYEMESIPEAEVSIMEINQHTGEAHNVQ